MKILYVSTISDTMNTFLIPHIKMLVDKGNRVDVAFNIKGEVNPEIYKLGCKVYSLSFNRNPLNVENFKTFRDIRKIIKLGKYEVVHCHTPIASACTRLACKNIKDIKIFYTAHGFHFYNGAPLKNWLIYYPVEKYLAKYTDTVITINKEDYRRATKFKFKRVENIPGVGVDLEKFNIKIDKNKKRKELGIEEEDFLILSVGELNRNKNHHIIIKALKKLGNPKVKYLICGEGPLKNEIENLIKSLRLENQVRLLGYRKDVPELDNVADLFAFPSKREGLPVSLMEAMVSGLPILASNIRGNKDLVDSDRGGYLFNLSEDNVDKYLKLLIEKKDKRKEFSKYNKEKSKKFDKEKALHLLEGVYQGENYKRKVKDI